MYLLLQRISFLLLVFLSSGAYASSEHTDFSGHSKTCSLLPDLKKLSPLPSIEIERLVVNPQIARQYYEVGLAQFRASWNPEVIESLKKIASDASDANTAQLKLNKSVYPKLKSARAPLKTLRFLFFALSEEHACPTVLDELTKAIGSNGDILKGRKAKDVIDKAASRLTQALKPEQVAKLDQALAEFQPTDETHFNLWFDKKIKETKAILEPGQGTAEDFHLARKNMQAILSVYQMKLALSPSDPELKKLVNFLLQKTEEIGDFHEGLEIMKTKGELKYKKDLVEYPQELCVQSLAFLKKLKKSMKE